MKKYVTKARRGRAGNNQTNDDVTIREEYLACARNPIAFTTANSMFRPPKGAKRKADSGDISIMLGRYE